VDFVMLHGPVGAGIVAGLWWVGLEWAGLKWVGLEWAGLEWAGLKCVIARAVLDWIVVEDECGLQ